MSRKDMLGTNAGALVTVAGPLEDLEQKLAGQDGDAWREALKRFLRKESPWPAPEVAALKPKPVQPPIAVWKTITIGGKSRDDLLAALESGGFRIADWARGMMAQKAFTIEVEPREVDITVLSVAELGFPKGATTSEIWARAKGLGLDLCPPSTGPHLRLACVDQPFGGWLWVAMKPIVGAVDIDSPYVFEVEHDDDGRWLGVDVANPGDRWFPEDRIAFVVPRKAE